MLLVFILSHLPIQYTNQYIKELEKNKNLDMALQIIQRELLVISFTYEGLICFCQMIT